MGAPPRMTAGQLFWWGVGLLAAGIALGQLLVPLYSRATPDVVLANALSVLISTASMLGVALIAASLAVAAVVRSQEERHEAAGQEAQGETGHSR